MGSEYEVKEGRWQPWGMSVPITLREIRAPVQLVVQKEIYRIPSTNTLMGFDMALKDWVAPNGKGKHADFEVFLTWDGKPLYYTQHTQLDVLFPEKHAGYYVFENIKGSRFGGPYMADTNSTFQTDFSCMSSFENGEPRFRGLDIGRSLIVRSRCKVDNEGRLVSADRSVTDPIGRFAEDVRQIMSITESGDFGVQKLGHEAIRRIDGTITLDGNADDGILDN